MILYHILILALVQGLTEFLPVSSSGHLALAHSFLGNTKTMTQSDILMLDVAVHLGTLLSVLVYFRKDIWMMLGGLIKIRQGGNNEGLSLILKILIGSFPVIIAGVIIKKLMPDWLGAIEVVAWMTLIFGIVLWVADRFFPKNMTVESMGYKDALFIGIAQVLALIPGVSRSGITMTAARMLGLSAEQAARYSLLLAIVAISGAGALLGLDVIEAQDFALTKELLLAILLSFISGWCAIGLMIKWLETHGFGVFVAYRILLGVGLLGLIYFTSWL